MLLLWPLQGKKGIVYQAPFDSLSQTLLKTRLCAGLPPAPPVPGDKWPLCSSRLRWEENQLQIRSPRMCCQSPAVPVNLCPKLRVSDETANSKPTKQTNKNNTTEMEHNVHLWLTAGILNNFNFNLEENMPVKTYFLILIALYLSASSR